MCDFFHPAVTMPPFPSAMNAPPFPSTINPLPFSSTINPPPFSSTINPPPHFAYTAPLPQRPFRPFQAPMHIGFPSYSSSSTPSVTLPVFEKRALTDLVVAQPSFENKGPPSPIDEGFGISREDRRASVVNLTLAPLTCPKSTIHVIVEEHGKIQKFPIHRDLLCFYSPYFRRILSGSKLVKAKILQKNHRREWRWEDKESVHEVMEIGGSADSEVKMDIDVVIKLPTVVREVKPDTKENKGVHAEMIFSDVVRELKLDTEDLGDVTRTVYAAFVNWLYHDYQGFGLHHPLDDHPFFDAVTLIQLWVLAGRIGVPECQNHCIEGIEWWRMTSNIIQTSMLFWVWENTEEYDSEECGLRSLLIDQCAWKLDGKWLRSELDGIKNEEQFPRQALVELVSRMRVVLNERIRPPFLHSELRKEAYWIEVEEKRFYNVIKEERSLRLG